MIPRSLSASSILVSEACMARWKAESYDRVPSVDNNAAMVGTTCHYAFEMFVKAVYIDKTTSWEDVKALDDFYKLGYIDTFGSTDFDTPEFADGAELVAKWYDRNKMGLPYEVVSCEVKETFQIKTSVGDIPFNYIWDRADKRGEGVYEVVDYKSIRGYVSADDLKRKIQPRAYALAAQIKWPDAEKIWVSFDMLRFDGQVGAMFTREDNVATYRYLQRAAERIIATPEDEVQETLNLECKWCIRKADCAALAAAHHAGTVYGLDNASLARKKLEVSSALEALKYLDDELDKLLFKAAEEDDVTEFEAGGLTVEFVSRKSRKANSLAISKIIGPDLAAKYGTIGVTVLDKMIKDGVLNDEQIEACKQYITYTYADPRPKVKAKDLIKEED